MQADSGQRNVLSAVGGCQSCLGVVAITAVFLLVGGGLSWWGWNILQDARASTTWPTVAGQVIRSEVTESTDAEGGDSYSPEVTYTYQVNQLSYENSTIKFGENSYDSRRRAEEIAAQYPVGERVNVSYDPAAPDRSVLEPGVSGGSYIVLSIGVVFVVISLVILIIAPIAALLQRRT
jgi:hypothetical protein